MRLPKGYGQIVKLSGKRRRPYAVRVEVSEEGQDHTWIRKTKYLEYFSKRSDALDWLAKYNAGIEVDVRPKLEDIPTFADVYKGFLEWYQAKNTDISRAALYGYKEGFKMSTSLHPVKFSAIRTPDLQAVISQHKHMSKSSVNRLIKLYHGMYQYAGMNDIIDKDYSQFVFVECKQNAEKVHKPFTDDEIRAVLDAGEEDILIMLYTGMRIGELLKLETSSINLEERYMVGGSKTTAGKDRIVPIHEAIVPYIEKRMGNKYLIRGGCRNEFVRLIWDPAMKRLNMDHLPHDTRHTTTSLMERYNIPLLHRKLILGHAVQDITEGVYTHVKPSELVQDINRIPAIW